MVNISKILKFLTLHGFDEFDWNDLIQELRTFGICHWRGMNDAKLIFVFPYFHFCLHAKAVMVAHFYFVIEGIK